MKLLDRFFAKRLKAYKDYIQALEADRDLLQKENVKLYKLLMKSAVSIHMSAEVIANKHEKRTIN